MPILIKVLYSNDRRILFSSLEMDFWIFYETADNFKAEDTAATDPIFKEALKKKYAEPDGMNDLRKNKFQATSEPKDVDPAKAFSESIKKLLVK